MHLDPHYHLTEREHPFMIRANVKRATERKPFTVHISTAILIILATLFITSFIADHVMHLTDVAYSPNSNATPCLQVKHQHIPVHGATPEQLTSLCAQYN